MNPMFGPTYMSYPVNPALTQQSTLLGGTSAATAMNNFGVGMSIAGALQSGIGAYFSVQSVKDNLKFQSDMSAINARIAEQSAQSILLAGEKEQGRVSMKAGKVKGAQRASQASRGIVAGVGSAAEEIATTDLIKETDMYTINANAVRQAWAARTQSVNAMNTSLLQGTSADSLNPYMAAGTSLIESGALVASSWYQQRRSNRIASILGVD